MTENILTRQSKSSDPMSSAPPGRLLQRACVCGQHSHAGGECAECSKKRLNVRRFPLSMQGRGGIGGGNFVPPVMHEALYSPGQPLDAKARRIKEPRFRHNFSQVHLHRASNLHADQAKSSASLPAFDEDVTQTPGTATGTAVSEPVAGGALPAVPAAKSKKAKLKSGPKYTPSGTMKATKSGSKKITSFKLSAEFENDSANDIVPSCGEVRQYILWTKEADIPNHAGFKPKEDYSANTWYEDRDDVGKRYGHRSGTYSECISINKYEDTKGNKDCANGEVFVGQDDPMDGSGKKTGKWKFKLYTIDSCNGWKVVGTPASVTVDWNV